MRRQLLPIVIAATLIMAAGSARADGYAAPKMAAAPMLTVSSWTGFYANGGVGYGVWSADTTTVNPVTGVCVLCLTQTQGGDGWLGEIGLGYDYQMSHNIVIGAFVNYDFSNLEGTVQDQGTFSAGDVEQKSAWFIGARAGWLMTPDILNYVGVGWTHAKFDGGAMNFTFANAGPTSFALSDVSSSGWFVSSGIEVAMHGGWYWRSEYRYAQYDNEIFTDRNAAGAARDNITFEPDVQTATSEIVYKFNWGH
jgi:outer membrane immunogenic protein